jgi:hypothetical protein
MSGHFSNETGHHSTSHIFPLPSFLLRRMPLSHSHRIRRRQIRIYLTFSCVNELVRSLNDLYHVSPSSSPSPLLLPILSSSHIALPASQQILRACGATALQVRLLDSLCQSARRFVQRRAYVPSHASRALQSDGDNPFAALFHPDDPAFSILADVLGAVSVPPPVISYSSASTVVPLIASRVSLPSIPSRVPLLSLLPPHKQLLYSTPTSMLVPDVVPSTRCFIGCDQHEYVQLIKRMAATGMLSFTTQPKVVNGLFGVAKPDGDIRLILDARPANSVFVSPPPIRLPSPTAFSNLYIDPSNPVYVAKMDLDNFYHQLLLPDWMCSYFCLPPICVDLLDSQVTRTFDTTARLVYPMCRTLPMGWSHSVDASQSLHQYILDTFTRLPRSSLLVDETSSYRYVDQLLYSPYVDDTTLLAPSELLLHQAIAVLAKAYHTAGVTVKWSKLIQPSCEGVNVLGLELHGRHATYGLAPDKMRRLILGTRSFLLRSHCTGRDLSRIVGSWTWATLVRRECLSVFRSVYRFCSVAGDCVFRIWKSVRRELNIMIGLAPLLYANLAASWSDRIVASDACPSGLGVSMSLAPHETMTTMARSTPVPSLDAPFSAVNMDMRLWRPVISARFRYAQHINTLEMKAVHTSLRWLLSHPASMGKRVLLLGDNQVVVHALSKGRSSAPTLVSAIRRLSCLVLASALRVSYRWIPSELNPADGPSRAFAPEPHAT